MSDLSATSLLAADPLLGDLMPPAPSSKPPARAPTMGNLQKLRYTHTAMIDLILTNPGISQGDLALAFGFTQGWVSNMIASDAFQSALAARREELIDPVIKASMEERMRGLVIRSQEVLMKKLEQPQVSDAVALKALELGAKGLGLGGHAPVRVMPVDLGGLKERLLNLRSEVYENKPEFRGNAERVVE